MQCCGSRPPVGPAAYAEVVNLVGRDREIAALRGLLGRAKQASGGVLVVRGPAGSGKTALADAVAQDARRLGFEVVRIAAGPVGSGRLLWAQLLSDSGGAPEQARRLLEPAGPLDVDEALRGLVSSVPRLIVIDDLDRAGPEAVEVLSLLASRLAGSATAVVVTTGTPVETGSTLQLGPLSEADLGTLTGERRPEVRRALWLAASGMPGPALQLAATLADAEGGGAPSTDLDPVALLALHAPSQAAFLVGDPPLVRLLECAAARKLPATLQARVLARLAGELLAEPGAGARRRALVEEALALARTAGEPRTLAEVLDARLHALWDPAAAEDRLAAASEIIELARAAGDEERERHGLFWRFMALMELGRVTEAEAVLAVFARAAELAGDARAVVMASARHAMIAVLRGRFDLGWRLTQQVGDAARAAAMPDAEALVKTLHGVIMLERGTPEQGVAIADELLAIARSRPGHQFEATAAAALAAFGQPRAAATELQRALPEVLAGSGPRWLGSVCGLALAAAAAHEQEAAARLYEVLAPYRGLLVVQGGAAVVVGPAAYYLGLLAAEAGRWDEAVALQTDAAALCERIGALPALAHARAALADALASRAGPGDRDRAQDLRRQALNAAQRLGMAVFLASHPPAADCWRLRQEGEDWQLDADGEHARLRDSRGLHYLRALLAAPGRQIPALDLVAGGPGVTATSTGPVLDAQARSQYRRRLDALAAELDAADRGGDVTGAERLARERRALLDELRRATGLGGRSRFASPEAERARVNATRTLRLALDRISRVAPKTGAYLDASVHTGQSCCYEPVPGGPPGWDV